MNLRETIEVVLQPSRRALAKSSGIPLRDIKLDAWETRRLGNLFYAQTGGYHCVNLKIFTGSPQPDINVEIPTTDGNESAQIAKRLKVDPRYLAQVIDPNSDGVKSDLYLYSATSLGTQIATALLSHVNSSNPTASPRR